MEGPPAEVDSNYLQNAHATFTGGYWHHNYIQGILGVFEGALVIENNHFGQIAVRGSDEQIIIDNNEILGLTEISGNIFFRGNLVVSDHYFYCLHLDDGVYQISNNTLIFQGDGINATLLDGQSQIVSNIFVGDGVNCRGVSCSQQSPISIKYNDFFQVNTLVYRCEIGPGNILLDPCFRAGNPYDYRLQANSPCIDAGDPALPLDPDGTRSDMGCYFFDHRIDNPPAIISPVVVNVQRGTTLRYIARATDDFGPLSFGFWDLPAWLYRVPELMDFEQKTAVVSGGVPQGQGNFTFGVWVEDGSAQRDSQEVSVLISPYTILAGEVTGLLDRARSPYLVIEDLVVPVGDSLVIEPGVEIRFQWEPVFDLRRRILIRGRLFAVGTPEDSIYFLPEFGDSLFVAWRGIQCIGASPETSRVGYAFLSSGYYGIVCDSQATVIVQHDRIVDTAYGIRVTNDAWAGVDSCEFLVFNPYLNNSCWIKGASASITNSLLGIPSAFQYWSSCSVLFRSKWYSRKLYFC